MRAILAAEHFDLTPAIRAHSEEQLQKLQAFLPEDAVLRVFLGMCSKKEFTVLLKAHWRGHDIVSTMRGPDLYSLVCRAATTMRQKFQKDKNRRISKRKGSEKYLENQPRSA
jgi:ribosomal subunit interface protein